NPAGVETLNDLAQKDLKLVLCAPQVPCGAATEQVADDAGVTLQPVSLEQSVTDVLGKVASGEADAGIVYRTDVLGSDGAVDGVELPEAADVVNAYPITAVAGSPNADVADQFVDFVLGAAGQNVL